jgi:hypothetical protein
VQKYFAALFVTFLGYATLSYLLCKQISLHDIYKKYFLFWLQIYSNLILNLKYFVLSHCVCSYCVYANMCCIKFINMYVHIHTCMCCMNRDILILTFLHTSLFTLVTHVFVCKELHYCKPSKECKHSLHNLGVCSFSLSFLVNIYAHCTIFLLYTKVYVQFSQPTPGIELTFYT